MKKLGILITILIVGIVTTLLGLRSWYNNAMEANSDYELTYALTVNPGDSAADVLKKLEGENVIRNALAARIYLKFNPTTIQAGEFEINTYMDVPTILKVLENAEDDTVWVTIPEGLRIDEVAAIWAEKIEDFSITTFETTATTFESRRSAEGYLFPDTYNVAEDISEQEAYQLMLDTFNAKVGEVDYDTLILASIVEREAQNENERSIVAGILKKRLDTYGWLVQADATLLYEHKDWKKVITQEMKDSDSPYNTYKNPSLPPTPICNPGLSSIDAARDPKDSNYWFYLHDEDGIIHYGATQEEHNQNIYEYLR